MNQVWKGLFGIASMVNLKDGECTDAFGLTRLLLPVYDGGGMTTTLEAEAREKCASMILHFLDVLQHDVLPLEARGVDLSNSSSWDAALPERLTNWGVAAKVLWIELCYVLRDLARTDDERRRVKEAFSDIAGILSTHRVLRNGRIEHVINPPITVEVRLWILRQILLHLGTVPHQPHRVHPQPHHTRLLAAVPV